jgi:hypothetical protein
MLADIARHDFGELRIAARVLPDDLTLDDQRAAF